MNRPISQHAPPRSAATTSTPQPEPAIATPEERHAAVCAGAIAYLPDLRAYARALTGNGPQADDLVQSAILRALSASQQFTPGTNFRAWGFTILRNAFYNQWRSPEARKVSLDETAVALAAVAPTQDASLEFCDFRRAFAQLVPDQREALLLIGAAGLSYEETAAICNCAPGTVKSRVSRARATLRAMMDGGVFNLQRRDVAPISTTDLALALETAIAARSLSKGEPLEAKSALRTCDGDVATDPEQDSESRPNLHLAGTY